MQDILRIMRRQDWKRMYIIETYYLRLCDLNTIK